MRKEDVCSFENQECVSFFSFEFLTKLETQVKSLQLICSSQSTLRLLVFVYVPGVFNEIKW